MMEKTNALLKENAALKVMTDELGQTLENHVKAHVSIIKDLDDEMAKADKQVSQCRARRAGGSTVASGRVGER